MIEKVLKIGSRKSALALRQTELFIQSFRTYYPTLSISFQIIPQETSGDRYGAERLSDIGGKGLFTKELDASLLRGDIDLAIYSLKDVETVLQDNITIACVLERGDARDVFISKNAISLQDLPLGAIIGTASPRRQSQLLNYRPDLRIRLIRGNVPTRLEKLQTEDFDGTLLALAGLQRLELEDVLTEVLDPECFVPAAGQGALVACIRKDRQDVESLLAPLNHHPTQQCITAERALLRALGASCRTPVGAYATKTSLGIRLKGFLGTEDGGRVSRIAEEGADPLVLGERVAFELKRLLGSPCSF